MAGYDTLLFDNDGILVDPPSRGSQVEAVRAAFRDAGVTDVDPQHVHALVRDVTPEGLDDICRAYDVASDELWAFREHHDEQAQFEAFEAGERDQYDDVAAIADLLQDCGVVSNNHHSTVAFVLGFFDLDPLFDTYYGRAKTVESLRLKKPNTHYLERAVTDLDGEAALYVGDSESDVVAAHRAGMDSAFVRRAHCRDADLSVEPTYDVETLHDVADLARG